MTHIFENLSTWASTSGPHSDIVISSRVRLARNFAGQPFPHLLSLDRQKQIIDDVGKVVKSKKFQKQNGILEIINLSELSQVEKWVLVEKHLISPQLAQGEGLKAVMVTEDETVSVMINEEDHLRIQCLLPGLNVEKGLKKSDSIDDGLEDKIDFAFNEFQGYLTVCPTNIGTGLRASVMLHLPALVMTKQADRVLSALSQLGLAVRGTYGEGTEAVGNLFQISNQVTLGKTEQEVLANLTTVTLQIIEQEKMAREILKREIFDQLMDRVWRAYGTLSNARIISSREAMVLLSELRLGVDLGIISDVDTRIFNEMLILIQPAFLQKYKNHKLTPAARDYARAEVIREKLQKDQV